MRAKQQPLHHSTLTGFGSYFSSESLPGALPIGQNSPQHPPLGLYAEQLSGSAFTAARHHNLRSWLYRIRPSVVHEDFVPFLSSFSASEFNNRTEFNASQPLNPQQLRWKPLAYPEKKTDFIQGILPWLYNGSPAKQMGAAVHLYAINASQTTQFFYNADAEFLIVPQEGRLLFHTEFGSLSVGPGEVIVIPRGVKFQVVLGGAEDLREAADLGEAAETENEKSGTKNVTTKARGYICENFGSPFRLPDLGLIGSNGLANPRDFHYPNANYYDKKGSFQLLVKFQGHLWETKLHHHPLDVVAWHGNYAPYKYDLRRFNTINTVSFDHPDPSIFTVLSSASDTPGMANVDFVIFPERWMVATNTFRPPYYHRNIMSEYMGLIYGSYDAKSDAFAPGGGSLHNCMMPHGPDSMAFEKAVQADTNKPVRLSNTLAFMFESRYVWVPTEFALQSDNRDLNYASSWRGLKSNFKIPS